MNLTISNKAKTIHPLSAQLIASRYSWLSLELAEPNLGVPPNVILNENSTTETWVLTSSYLGVRGWASYDPLNFPFFSLERPDLETVGDAIDELIYRDPDPLRFFLLRPDIGGGITPITNLVVELGDPAWCNTASLSWVSNKRNPLAMVEWYLDLTDNPNSSFFDWKSGDTTFTSYPSRIGDEPFCLQSNQVKTIQYRLTGEDWSGKRGFATLNTLFRPAVYYGVTQNNTPGGLNWPIANDVNDPSIKIKRITTSVVYDHFVDFSNESGNLFGKHFYIAIPQNAGFNTNPTVYLGTFETPGNLSIQGEVYTNVNILNIHNVSMPYTVIVSENQQRGRVRISYR